MGLVMQEIEDREDARRLRAQSSYVYHRGAFGVREARLEDPLDDPLDDPKSRRF